MLGVSVGDNPGRHTPARLSHLQRGVLCSVQEGDEAGHDVGADDFVDGGRLLCKRPTGGRARQGRHSARCQWRLTRHGVPASSKGGRRAGPGRGRRECTDQWRGASGTAWWRTAAAPRCRCTPPAPWPAGCPAVGARGRQGGRSRVVEGGPGQGTHTHSRATRPHGAAAPVAERQGACHAGRQRLTALLLNHVVLLLFAQLVGCVLTLPPGLVRVHRLLKRRPPVLRPGRRPQRAARARHRSCDGGAQCQRVIRLPLALRVSGHP